MKPVLNANPSQIPDRSMKLETLQNLYIHELQDLHSAEMQIKSALPRVIKAATSPDLKEALKAHLEVTKHHVERLNEILKRHDEKRESEKCKGMEGLLKESESMLEQEGDAILRDLGIISGCQRVEHYEMAGYGNARTFAEQLGHSNDFALLTETLEEESSADDELTSVASILLSQCEADASDDDEEGSSAPSRRKVAQASR